MAYDTKAKTWETFVVDLSKIDFTEAFDADDMKSSNIYLVLVHYLFARDR